MAGYRAAVVPERARIEKDQNLSCTKPQRLSELTSSFSLSDSFPYLEGAGLTNPWVLSQVFLLRRSSRMLCAE
jgi:hypothetical protein